MQSVQRHQPDVWYNQLGFFWSMCKHTRRSILELLLNDMYEGLDFPGWPTPEYKAVAWIHIVVFFLCSIQLDEMLIENPAAEIFRQNLGFLLAVARLSM
jgi:hypothetical protein